MRLRITNLGPVREAELDLSRDFIVLTGPNNSGKTYLTWAAYSLARLSPGVVKKLEPPAAVVAWVDRLFEARDRTVTVGSLLEIADDVFEVIANGVQKQLADDFAAPKDRFRDTRIEISEIVGDSSERRLQRVSFSLTHEGRHINFSSVDVEGELSLNVHHRPRNGKLDRVPLDDWSGAEIAELKRGVCYLVLQFLFNRLFDSTYCVARDADRPASATGSARAAPPPAWSARASRTGSWEYLRPNKAGSQGASNRVALRALAPRCGYRDSDQSMVVPTLRRQEEQATDLPKLRNGKLLADYILAVTRFHGGVHDWPEEISFRGIVFAGKAMGTRGATRAPARADYIEDERFQGDLRVTTQRPGKSYALDFFCA